MSNKTLTIGVIIAIALAAGAFFFPNNHVKTGAVSPSDAAATNYTEVTASNGMYIGAGGMTINSGLLTLSGGTLKSNTSATSSTATSQTLVAADVNGYDTIIFTPNVAGDTLTLFASSTATTFLPTAGNSQTTCIINGTTTANVNITLAGGTGTVLQVASSSATALGSLVIAPQKQGCITFTRANSTATTFDIIAALNVFK